MNDYIAKPLKPSEIYACLDRWVGKAAVPAPAVQPAPAAGAQALPDADGVALREILLRLIALLERDDLGAVGCMDELANHPEATAHEMELGRVAVLIRGFQFERALERLAHFRRLVDPE